MARSFFPMLLFLLANSLLNAQANWTAPSTLNSSSRLEDLCFLNPDTGWVCSGGGHIYRSLDGAQSWELQFQSPYYIRSIGFMDKQLGFAGTLDGVFLRTSNGGENWQNITSLLPIIPSGVCGMQALDENRFLAVGAWFEPAFMISTDDRGESWQALDMEDYAAGLVDVHFFSPDTGLVCGRGYDGGVVLRTTNGGESWTEVFNTGVEGDYVWKLQFLDEQFGVASVQTFAANGWLLVTEDGGQTWEAKVVPYGNVQGVGFISPQIGWMGGYEARLYATEDGGDSWAAIPFGGNFNRFQVFDSTLAYASGSSVYKYQDTTVASSSEEPMPRGFDPRLAVSPNPAAEQATVVFFLPRANNVDLNVYDSSGRLAAPVFRGRLPEGRHEFSLQLGRKGYQLVGLQLNEGLFSVPLMIR